MTVAVIPARGGSKRIPRKNIKDFCGRPIIAYSIKAALEADCFNRIIVSTDDDEIADIARVLGAEVPFLRPAEISGDYATTAEVIAHAVAWLEKNEEAMEYLCCIYPTAPFLSADDIASGYTIIKQQKLSYVFSATRFDYPIQRAFKLEAGKVKMFQPEFYSARSQDLEPAYHDAGQFYWGEVSAFLDENKIVFDEYSSVVELPLERVQDLDTEQDWRVAELKFKLLKDGNVCV